MFDITPIVQAAFALIGVIITVIVIPYIRSKTTAAQQAAIQDIINIAVYAAEQTITGAKMGAEKKAAVLAYLQEKGITYDAATIDKMIEAAVKQLNISQNSEGK